MSNKERIEQLEAGLTVIQDNMKKMEDGVVGKLTTLEQTIKLLSESILSNKGSDGTSSSVREVPSRPYRGGDDSPRLNFSSKTAKLAFPKYSGDDPTEWFNRAAQFFEYQGTLDDEKVPLASFHLEGEANQWWQWIQRVYKDEGKTITWEAFEEELWARFGPTDCEDFDESLSKIKQTGSLREYQKEFERLGNRVHGWTQKALVGTFMGGLKHEISEGIRMFKPKSLKEAISLARMKDEQVSRQRKFNRSSPSTQPAPGPLSIPIKTSAPIKKLTWDEMQKRRAQGLCFNCNEKFTFGHKCQRPQLLLLEGDGDFKECIEEEEDQTERPAEPEISLHALTGWSTPRTMRVMARIGSVELAVLIDSGSTHNFISSKIADKLQLPVIPTEMFTVRVANGNKLQCRGRYENIEVHLQGTFRIDSLFSTSHRT